MTKYSLGPKLPCCSPATHEEFQKCFDIAGVLLVLLNRRGRVVRINKKAAKVLGWKQKDIIGKPWFSHCVPSRIRRSVAKVFRMLIRGQLKPTSEYFDNPVMNRKGEERLIRWHNTVLRDHHGRITGTLSSGEDVTREKQDEEALRDSIRRFQAIFNSTFQFIALLKPDGRVLEVNQTALDFSGSSLRRIRGKLFWKCPWWAVSFKIKTQLRHALEHAAAGNFIRYETSAKGKGGIVRMIDFSLNPVKNDLGRVIFLVAEGRDITERKQSEDALRANEKRLRAIFDNAQDGILIADITTRKFAGCNKRIAEMLGYSEPELLSLSIEDIHPPEQLPRVLRSFYRFAQNETSKVQDLPMKRRDGSIFYVDVSCSLTEFLGREHLVGFFRDVTERKQWQAKLSDSEKKHRALFESAHDAIFLMSSDRFLDCNPSTLKMFGCKKKDIIHRTPFRFSPPTQPDGRNSKEKALQLIKATLDGTPQFFEWKHMKLNGETFDAEVSLNRIELGDQMFIQAIVRDISDRKKSQETVKQAARDWQTTFDAMNSAIWVLDKEQRILRSNKTAEKFFGAAGKHMLGRRCWEVVHGTSRPIYNCPVVRSRKSLKREVLVLPIGKIWYEMVADPILDDSGAFAGAVHIVRDITERKKAEMTMEHLLSLERAALEATADGILVVDRSGKISDFNERFIELWRIPEELIAFRDDKKLLKYVLNQLKDPENFLSGVRWLYENPEKESSDVLKFKDGRIFERYSCPQKVGDRVVGRVWSFRDVTEKKRVEVFRNEIIRTVSHELRTPLSIGKEGVKLLLDEVNGGINPEQKDILDTVMKNMNRLAGMIDDLLDISRIEAGQMKLEKKEADLSVIVHEVVSAFRLNATQRGIDLIEKKPAGVIKVFVDKERIIQVLNNLLDNSLKFTEKGKILVSLRVLKKEVECSIRDTGSGLSPDQVDAIFEKFQQFTRATGPGRKGLGLGLSISREIIERHGGRIWAKSEPGKGTRVTFALPIYEGTEFSK